MDNNYNRELLLHEALIQNEMDLQDLSERVQMSEEEIIDGLTGPDQVRLITRISDAIGIDSSYFWGGMRYDEDGNLVKV